MRAMAGIAAWCAGGVCERGGSECERGVCAWSIIRNSFGYIAISIVLNRKTSFYVIAEKWLKRNYIMNGRDKKGEEGEEKRAASSVAWEV